jgi:hypothetical protein
MKRNLLAIISFLAIVGCNKKDTSFSSEENKLNKTKEYVAALGFDLGKVTIDTKTKVNPDSVLKFSSAEEGRTYFKNYFKQFNSRKANCIDTLKSLSKSSKDFNAYFRSLIERSKSLKTEKKSVIPQMATSSADYSNSNIEDHEVEDWSLVFDNCELPGSYDPTLPSNQGLWWEDYQNGAWSSFKGKATMTKFNIYYLSFDYSFNYPDPIGRNVKTWMVPSVGVTWTSFDYGSFNNYPGSALIYFSVDGTQTFAIDRDGSTVVVNMNVNFEGYYNANTKAYTLNLSNLEL